MISVAIYGTSVAMSALCAGLQQMPDLEVRGIQNLSANDIATPDAGLPDVILFDLGEGQPGFAIPLLQKNPTTLLIGVDLTTHRMLVLSGEHSRLSTVDDLMQVIGQAKAPTR